MSLTDAGEAFLPLAEKILADLDAALETVASGIGGRVRISVSTAFGEHVLMPMMPKLRRLLPDVRFDLLVTDDRLDLAKEGIDIAIRLGVDVGEESIAARVGDIRYVLCAAPDWAAGTPVPVHPIGFSAIDCLRYSIPGLRDAWVFGDGPAQEVVPVSGTLDVSSPSAMRAAALQGLGPAVLAHWLVQKDLKDGRLVDLMPGQAVRPGTSTERSGIWLVYPSRDYLPTRVRRTLDILGQEIRSVTRI